MALKSGFVQGFEEYGVWACGAHPVPNLQKALNLKVHFPYFQVPAVSVDWLDYHKFLPAFMFAPT